MKKLAMTIFSIIILLFSSMILILTPIISGQDYEFGTNIRINDDTGTHAQRTPDIGVAQNGNIFAVWGDERNGDSDIFASVSTDNGRLFGDQIDDNDVRVDNGGTSSQREPALAIYNNNFYVVWMDDRTGFYHIYFAKSTNNGASFSGHTKVDNLQSEVICEYPDVAVSSSDGKISVVWQSNDRIYYSESTDDGASFSSSTLVDNSVPIGSEQKYPKVTTGSSGDKYIVWEDNRSGGADFDIYFATAGPSSTTFGSVTRVDEGTAGKKAERPAIAAYGASNVYLIWVDERDGASGDIYFDNSSDKGSTWSTDTKVDDQTKGIVVQDRPAIAVDGQGVIHAVWEDKRTSELEIYYSNSTDNGATFGSNIQVDDATQNIECREPAIAVRNVNNIYICWKDARNTDTDIYFSKWGIAGQSGYPPELKFPKVNPSTGGLGDKFTWEVTYIDLDNEEPDSGAGYPKLYIYTDNTKNTQISGSPFQMFEKFGQSQPYSQGRVFSKQLTINEDHDYRYMIEVKAADGDTSLRYTDLETGPKIDSIPPIFSKPAPDPNKWLNKPSVDCSISITDPGGSGVKSSLIKYQYLTNGSTEFTRYYTNAKYSSITDGYRCTATITFKEGAENFIRWNASDEVQSGELGYSLSETYEIKIDTTPVTFTDPVPLDINWQNKESVTCSITLNDFGGSGVNGSTIKYYYLPAGTVSYQGPYTASVQKVAESIKATTPSAVTFNNGPGNFIKWEATDIAGNNKISEAFEVNIDTTRPDNTPPEAPKWLKPKEIADTTPTIEWDKGYDADGDDLTYFIQIGTFLDGTDVLEWTSTGQANRYIFENPLLVGTYYIQVRAFDDWDYSPILKQTLNITASSTNNPPLPPTSILPNVVSEHRPQFSWLGASDPDGDDIDYLIRLGTSTFGNEIFDWKYVGKNEYYTYDLTKDLNDGIYYFQIITRDSSGATSAPYQEMIKIATFQPELDIPIEISATQGDLTATIKFTVLNNGTMSDNITLNVTSDLFSKSGVVVKLKPDTPYLLTPDQEKSFTLTIELPPLIAIADYTIEFVAESEDGDTKSFSHTTILHVNRKKPKDNGDNGVQDGEDDGSPLGQLLPMIILLIIVIVIIAVIAGVFSHSKKKKQEQKAKSDFFKEQNEYEKLYGPKKEY